MHEALKGTANINVNDGLKTSNIYTRMNIYCANQKTVKTRIIFGILLCWEEKANQMQDGKTARSNGN